MFSEAIVTGGIVNALAPTFRHILREFDLTIEDYLLNLNGDSKDLKCWNCTANGTFLVKSFYTFLIDGGMHDQPS